MISVYMPMNMIDGRNLVVSGLLSKMDIEMHYKKVYDLSIEKEMNDLPLCEEVFYILNMRHPEDYKLRSLSVGDVLYIKGKYYACNVIGFYEVKF